MLSRSLSNSKAHRSMHVLFCDAASRIMRKF
jgi:hypothetical protein